ncbi:MAG: hypothetical protein A2051_07750 [Desulfovibrionales bacterium GWA2_65_9]|nr:MAG: hypothetical protein A2051_07750 [Desulfovibrionales bacterium GWA2_65_9]
MLTTRDPEMDRRFRLLRQHGMSLSDLERHRAGTVQIERYLVTGHNYRMTDIQAAVGLAQLTRLPEILRRRRATAAAYGQNLARVPGVTPPSEPAYARSNWQTYMVRLGPSSDQLAVMQRLLDKGVPSRRGIMCAHLEPPYASAWPEGCLPHSEEATRRCIALPMHHEMDASACATVARTLKEVLHP